MNVFRPPGYATWPRDQQDAWYAEKINTEPKRAGLEPPAMQFRPTRFKHRDLATFPRRQFIYGRHYIRGFLSSTVAPTGVGKTSLSVTDIVAMTACRDLLGIRPVGPLRVWYWNGEDPVEEIQRRVEAACLHFDLDPSLLEDRLFIDSGRDTEIIVASQTRAGAVVASPVEAALAEALTAGEFDVLILDPLVAAHRVSENDNMAIDAVAKTFGRIAGATNCAIEAIHHVRKTGGAEITAEDSRGASALLAAARSVRVLNPMSEKEAEAAGVGNDRQFYFRSDIGKANLAPPSTKATWFKLESVPLGNGSGGPADDQDYVGVATPWTWPDAFESVTTSDLGKVQAAIVAGRWRESSQAKDWAGYAVAAVLKLDPRIRAHKAKIVAMLKTWIANGMLVVVEGLDAKREKRSFIEVGEPVSD